MSQTVYNGSWPCACGRLLTPLEAIVDDMCPKCRAAQIMDSLTNGMNGGTMASEKGGK